ncbi:hypothetical protein [Guptibacillus spartinae]|uniref:hypothetical protein n=1 Tax=Guptibacillus spartinae TaxID=3025679 RepID=UPI002362D409|nr:hypothetical protein [Pseudalkalibacillus spartinae]
MLKKLSDFIHYEMVILVIPVLVFGHVKWNLSLYLCFALFGLSVGLYYFFKKAEGKRIDKKEKVE